MEEQVRWVLVGRIVRPVGLRGEMVIETTGGDPGRFLSGKRFAVGEDRRRTLVVESSRPCRRRLAVRFRGVQEIGEAEELRGEPIWADEEDLPPLPEGTYYHYQLIGLDVVDGEGLPLGRIESILETGSSDVYCVGRGAKEILVPAVAEFIAQIDLEARRLVLAVPVRALIGEEPS